MADNRITKARLKNHWTYGWWKYLIMVVLVVMSVNVGFSVTAYKPSEEHRIEVYLCQGWADAEQFQADFWPALQEAAPDQEELTVMNIDLTSDDIYANMQFSTYVAAQQNDMCLLPRSEVKKLAEDEAWSAFAELTPYIESGALEPGDIAAFAAGMTLGDGLECLPAGLEILSPTEALVTLREGKFHQVKRMLAARGKPVLYLKRLSMGPLMLENTLPAGNFRHLTEAEIDGLRRAAGLVEADCQKKDNNFC